MSMKSPKKDQVTPERLMQFGFAYAPPLIIGAAASNKVFDSLESEPKTVEQISKATGASERGLRAIMNALVGLELLKKNRQGKYSLTSESAAFLEIVEAREGEAPQRLFSGWMFASSPALSALENPIYDLWVLDCKNEASASGATTP